MLVKINSVLASTMYTSSQCLLCPLLPCPCRHHCPGPRLLHSSMAGEGGPPHGMGWGCPRPRKVNSDVPTPPDLCREGILLDRKGGVCPRRGHALCEGPPPSRGLSTSPTAAASTHRSLQHPRRPNHSPRVTPSSPISVSSGLSPRKYFIT